MLKQVSHSQAFPTISFWLHTTSDQKSKTSLEALLRTYLDLRSFLAYKTKSITVKHLRRGSRFLINKTWTWLLDHLLVKLLMVDCLILSGSKVKLQPHCLWPGDLCYLEVTLIPWSALKESLKLLDPILVLVANVSMWYSDYPLQYQLLNCSLCHQFPFDLQPMSSHLQTFLPAFVNCSNFYLLTGQEGSGQWRPFHKGGDDRCVPQGSTA